jgi:signal transduction histidine kinase
VSQLNRGVWLWIGFALFAAVGLSAVGTLSLMVWRLDEAEAKARHVAAVEENLRLALWRMDSALTPLLAQENARPLSDYSTHHGYLDGNSVPSNSASHAPPIIMDDTPEWIQRRFLVTIESKDPVTEGTMGAGNFEGSGDEKARSMNQVEGPLTENLETSIASSPRLDARIVWNRLPATSSIPAANPQDSWSMPAGDRFDSRSRAVAEFNQRSQNFVASNAAILQMNTGLAGPAAQQPWLTPLWEADQLLLARRIVTARSAAVQGCMIDWDSLELWLLELARDLLPEARLEPVTSSQADGEPGMLAALPARLIPGRLPEGIVQRTSVVGPTLVLAWSAILTSLLAGGLIVRGVIGLSQRRAAFVSAVTHELRTPLTTFQMYTEMLARDMVTDPDTRREYLETLHAESWRLTHMVENVLAFARLERGRVAARITICRLDSILDELQPRLHELAANAGMQLLVEESLAWQASVRVDLSLTEQILRNLIDNSCKYAVECGDRRIHLSAVDRESLVELRIRDFGPGLPRRRGWYRPFSKSADEAAVTAPGIGLGLALSRRLARQMGATLRLDRKVQPGACFALQLPKESPIPP